MRNQESNPCVSVSSLKQSKRAIKRIASERTLDRILVYEWAMQTTHLFENFHFLVRTTTNNGIQHQFICSNSFASLLDHVTFRFDGVDGQHFQCRPKITCPLIINGDWQREKGAWGKTTRVQQWKQSITYGCHIQTSWGHEGSCREVRGIEEEPCNEFPETCYPSPSTTVYTRNATKEGKWVHNKRLRQKE